MSQRRRLVLGGVWLLVFVSLIVAGILGGMAYNRISASSSIAEPTRITVPDFTTERESARVVHAVVTFRADGTTVTTRLDGSRSSYGYLPLRVVYDADDPKQALLASDYDGGRRTSTAVTAWICLAIIVLDVGALVFGAVLLARKVSRQARDAAPRVT